MAYCDADTDVRPLVLQVTDAVKSDSEVSYFISLADDYINSRLVRLYQVPFSSTPPVIKQISSHLSAYLTIRSIYAEHKENPKDSWMTSFKEWAKELLTEIESGLIMLVDSSGNRIARHPIRGISSTPTNGNIFDIDDERNWRVPNADLDDANQKRDQ